MPGIRQFVQQTGEKPHVWAGNLWPSWRAFLDEAGLASGEMTQAVPEDDMLACLAELTREHGRFPLFAELRFAHTKRPAVPTEKTFRRRFGGQQGMIDRLREWVTGKSEFADILKVLETVGESKPKRIRSGSAEEQAGAPSMLGGSFIPPVVDCLPALAAGDAEIERQCIAGGVELAVEFEKRVAFALQMLGLEVSVLGQGAGRVADGIARCRSGRWALVYDAKVRRAGFSMGTEDRKFREYIELHGRDLERDGIDNLYFAVVSSSFAESDLQKAREVVRRTKAKAFVLLEASALRALVEVRLRTRRLEDAAVLERFFTSTKTVGLSDVKSLLL